MVPTSSSRLSAALLIRIRYCNAELDKTGEFTGQLHRTQSANPVPALGGRRGLPGGPAPLDRDPVPDNGEVSAGGEKYGPETGYEFLANEGPVPVEAVEPTEFLCMVLHTF
jgi:hypothetical protein